MSNFPISLPAPSQPAFPTTPVTPPFDGTPETSDFDILVPAPSQPAFPSLESPSSPALPPSATAGQAGLNAYQLAVIGAEGVPPFEGTLAEWLLSLHAAGEVGDISRLWVSLVNSWTEEPTLNAEAPALGGEVYDYVFGTTTYYRHVPSPYEPTQDAFYEAYAAGVLSELVVAKGLVI
jgi:hypothetical protein